jgi:hypothetical protein
MNRSGDYGAFLINISFIVDVIPNILLPTLRIRILIINTNWGYSWRRRRRHRRPRAHHLSRVVLHASAT